MTNAAEPLGPESLRAISIPPVGLEGTIPHRLARDHAPIRVGNPSGVLPVDADVSRDDDGRWSVRAITVYRTQRRLMEGSVLVPDR